MDGMDYVLHESLRSSHQNHNHNYSHSSATPHPPHQHQVRFANHRLPSFQHSQSAACPLFAQQHARFHQALSPLAAATLNFPPVPAQQVQPAPPQPSPNGGTNPAAIRSASDGSTTGNQNLRPASAQHAHQYLHAHVQSQSHLQPPQPFDPDYSANSSFWGHPHPYSATHNPAWIFVSSGTAPSPSNSSLSNRGRPETYSSAASFGPGAAAAHIANMSDAPPNHPSSVPSPSAQLPRRQTEPPPGPFAYVRNPASSPPSLPHFSTGPVLPPSNHTHGHPSRATPHFANAVQLGPARPRLPALPPPAAHAANAAGMAHMAHISGRQLVHDWFVRPEPPGPTNAAAAPAMMPFSALAQHQTSFASQQSEDEHRRRARMAYLSSQMTASSSDDDDDDDDDSGNDMEHELRSIENEAVRADMRHYLESIGMRRGGGSSLVRNHQLLRGQMTNKRVASKRAIASLESVAIDNLEERDRTCVICYNDYGVTSPEGINEAPLRLPTCRHVFGDYCIKKWFEESDSCPYCRRTVPSEVRVKLPDSAMRQLFHSPHYRAVVGRLDPEDPLSNYRMHSEAMLNEAFRTTSPSRSTQTGQRRSSPTEIADDRPRTRARHGGLSGGNDSTRATTQPSQHQSMDRERLHQTLPVPQLHQMHFSPGRFTAHHRRPPGSPMVYPTALPNPSHLGAQQTNVAFQASYPQAMDLDPPTQPSTTSTPASSLHGP